METPNHGQRKGEPALLVEIRRALENKDIEALANLYNDDAVLEEVSALDPPSHPAVVKGREAILKRLKKDLMRDPISGWERHVKSSQIIDQVETDDALAFTEVRTFEAGDQMVAQHIIHKKDGRIEHDRVLVAWDAAA
jgi:hypothetical protein